jgi:hypothetical protein
VRDADKEPIVIDEAEAADDLRRIVSLNRKVDAAKLKALKSGEVHKEDKKAVEALQDELNDLIHDIATPRPLLTGGKPRDDEWRSTPLGELARLPVEAVDHLWSEHELQTVGDLDDALADGTTTLPELLDGAEGLGSGVVQAGAALDAYLAKHYESPIGFAELRRMLYGLTADQLVRWMMIRTEVMAPSTDGVIGPWLMEHDLDTVGDILDRLGDPDATPLGEAIGLVKAELLLDDLDARRRQIAGRDLPADPADPDDDRPKGKGKGKGRKAKGAA